LLSVAPTAPAHVWLTLSCAGTLGPVTSLNGGRVVWFLIVLCGNVLFYLHTWGTV
jgi:hypothetical protein